MTTGIRRGIGLTAGAWALAALLAGTAAADVSVEDGGSILIFPKVINSGGRTTLIQMSNSGNTLLHLHCFYTDARPLNPNLPVGPTNPALWQEVDFFLWLTRQQPTAWLVSQGRSLNPLDANSGIDPGFIPSVSPGFTGELLCLEVDSSGMPIAANKLTGDATLLSPSGDASRYAAIAIQAGPLAGENGSTLELDNEHYNSCPRTLVLNHFAAGAPDPVAGPPDDYGNCAGGCPIQTELTLVPCGRDFENQVPGRATVTMEIYNEFEERLSGSLAVDCWLNRTLGGSTSYTVLGTLTGHTRLVASGGGILGVAEETHRTDSGAQARAAWNLPTEGSFYEPGAGRTIIDRIVIPRIF